MRVVKNLLIVVGIFSSLITTIVAQNPKKANIWYFGVNAGLDFSLGNPTAIKNGALQALEGVSTICDDSGTLLFYTNGGEYPFTGAVWNRNHQVMPNGYLNGAGGCNSSLQSSLVVQRPGSSNQYYLFTTDCYENNFADGLSYSIIDMNLDGGLGDISVKGIKLADNSNESLTGIKHANGKDYWILTHIVDTDSFYAFHLTREGISGVVKTAIGPIAQDFAGEIKASFNGEKLVFAGLDFTALFDFDANTGVISNYQNLNTPSYTAAFSPNCEVLYVAKFQNKTIYQFDLLHHNPVSTKTIVGYTSRYVGSMQLGPNKKIYVSLNNYGYLGIINRPDIRGSNCDYVNNGIFLEGKYAKVGLPNYTNDILGECLPYPKENITQYPSGINLLQKGTDNVSFSWNDQKEAIKYRIRQKTEDQEWETFTTFSNTYSSSDLKTNTTYEFQLEAIIMKNGIYELIHDHYFADITSEKSDSEANKNTLTIETTSNPEFLVYPNPAKHNTKIEAILGDQESSFEVKIFDTSGKLVFSEIWETQSGSNSFEIPLDDLQSGVYNLSMSNENINQNKRLVVIN